MEMTMTRQINDLHDAYITLNWYDIQEMLTGHHPLVLVKIILQHEAPFNPPTRLELGDQINNAEYLCKVMRDLGIHIADLLPISEELCHLTAGLTTVVDSVVEQIVDLVVDKGLCQSAENKQRLGVWRKTGLVDKQLGTIKRAKPLKKGANYADPENKAFPLDTPERVRASHAYLHKYWNSGAKSGITATYNKQKFIDVHRRIITRMRRLGIDHNSIDSLDSVTKRHMKATQKAKAMQKTDISERNPRLLDTTKIKEIRNDLSSILSDHILYMKNYISACDERNDGLASTMDESINENSRSLLKFLEKYFPGYKPNEAIDREGLMKQFMAIWDDYLDAIKSLVVGGDSGNDGMARDGLRRLFLVKNKMVKYFISVLASVAEEKDLDKILTSWVTHLQGYIEARDNDDFATSLQNLKDWQQTKDDFVEKLCSWIVSRDTVNINDMPAPRQLDLDVDAPLPPTGVSNPPAPFSSPTKDANAIRRDVNSPAAAKSMTAAQNKDTSSIGIRRAADVRENAIGHFPYRDDCVCDSRNGKCYKKH